MRREQKYLVNLLHNEHLNRGVFMAQVLYRGRQETNMPISLLFKGSTLVLGVIKGVLVVFHHAGNIDLERFENFG